MPKDFSKRSTTLPNLLKSWLKNHRDNRGIAGFFVDAKDDKSRMFYLGFGFNPLLDSLRLFLPVSILRILIPKFAPLSERKRPDPNFRRLEQSFAQSISGRPGPELHIRSVRRGPDILFGCDAMIDVPDSGWIVRSATNSSSSSRNGSSDSSEISFESFPEKVRCKKMFLRAVLFDREARAYRAHARRFDQVPFHRKSL